MAFSDLRVYISKLEEEGELQRVRKEVDWNLEVGAIYRRCLDIGAPAPLFERIRGYPEGYRVFAAPVGPSNKPNRYYARLATALGIRPESSASHIIEEYIRRKKAPLKPVLVSGGPCKENVHLGEEVDLLEFPVPLFHGGDGGRFIGTWCSVITRDPDTGWVNYGTYRMMVHDRQTSGISILPPQHIGLHYYQKYEARSMPMECAVAIGPEPLTSLMSGMQAPTGVDEADIVGGLRQEPLELVKCETVNLSVPATSEIVLEGVVPPHERRVEGPFGEYAGYMGRGVPAEPVFHVKAITHRNDPILAVQCHGVPVDDYHLFGSLFRAGELLDYLRSQGFPVKSVYIPPSGVTHMTVVSTRVPQANYAMFLAQAIWGSHIGKYSWFLVITDDDIDVTDMNQVVWAISTRCHPDRGIFKVPRTAGHPRLPFQSQYERQHYMGSQVLIDCTWPREWEYVPETASFTGLWPKEIQEKVLKTWEEYGFSA